MLIARRNLRIRRGIMLSNARTLFNSAVRETRHRTYPQEQAQNSRASETLMKIKREAP